jgi:hypothetical protein
MQTMIIVGDNDAGTLSKRIASKKYTITHSKNKLHQANAVMQLQ